MTNPPILIRDKNTLDEYILTSFKLINLKVNPTVRTLVLMVADAIDRADNILDKHEEDRDLYSHYYRTCDGLETCVTLRASTLANTLNISQRQLKNIASAVEDFGFSYNYTYSKKSREGYYLFSGHLLPEYRERKTVIPKFLFDLGLDSASIITYVILLNNMLRNKEEYADCTYSYLEKGTRLSFHTISKSISRLKALGIVKVFRQSKYKDYGYTYTLFSKPSECYCINNICASFKEIDKLDAEANDFMNEIVPLVEVMEKSAISGSDNSVSQEIYSDKNTTYVKHLNSVELSQLAKGDAEKTYILQVINNLKLNQFKKVQIRKAVEYGVSREKAEARVSAYIGMYLKMLLINYHKYISNQTNENRKIYLQSLENNFIARRRFNIIASAYFRQDFEEISKNKVKDMISYSYAAFCNLFKKSQYWDYHLMDANICVLC